jgi:transposase-like protein
MKTRTRVDHSREFKLEAIRLIEAGKKPVTQIARELGVSRQLLHSWVREAEKRKGQPASDVFRGNGNRTSADAELTALRRKVAQLEEDNEILKKATAFFAKESR